MAHAIRCQKVAFYDIVWEMAYDLKYHEVWQYEYKKNRLDQTNGSTDFEIASNKIKRMEKNLYGNHRPNNFSKKHENGVFDPIFNVLWEPVIFMKI